MRGVLLALAAYVAWGCFPLYFSLLDHVAATEVLANRILWSFFSTLLIILLWRRGGTFIALLKNPEIMRWLLLSSVLIAINWLLFIWAVTEHRVMESSLGYYMTPLVSLLLARVLLKETLRPIQAVAAGLATVAVLWELFSL
ncbi:MAG: EamA family transporter, partial [Natronospirillum sp.]